MALVKLVLIAIRFPLMDLFVQIMYAAVIIFHITKIMNAVRVSVSMHPFKLYILQRILYLLVAKLSYLATCSNTTEPCNGYIGLQCTNSTCVCKSNTMWNGTSCRKYSI